jgi:hypothetical protein
MEYTDYLELLPTQPPEGAIEFCQSKGKLIGDLMIYEAAYVRNPITEKNEKKVKVKCTACGEVYYLDYVSSYVCRTGYVSAPFGFFNYDLKTNVISGDTTMCPECGAKARAAHIQNFYNRTYRMSHCHLLTVEIIENRPALISWFIEYNIDRYGEKQIRSYMYEAYVYEKKKCLKYKGYTKYFCSTTFKTGWYQAKQCIDTYGKADLLLPFPDDIFHGTDFENSKFEIFSKIEEPHLITYLRLYQKHKNVENLIMQGFSEQIDTLIADTGGGYNIRKWSSNIDGIEWKKTRPHEMLGLDIEAYRVAKAQKWTIVQLNFFRTHYQAKGWEFLTADNLKFVDSYSKYEIEQLISRKLPVLKILKYLNSQKDKISSNKDLLNIGYYRDYIDTCKKLDVDITRQSALFPPRLIQSHDAVMQQFKFKKSEILNKKLEERLPYLDNFCFEADGLLIRPAGSHQELIDEGATLHHCVATYAERHAKGSTTIFFIRKADKPDESFYTLEFNFNNQSVEQNRGKHNCARTDEVKAFEEKWLKFAKKKIKELKKNGKSVDAA